MDGSIIRRARLAGTWYPELASGLERLFQSVETPAGVGVRGAVLPHAGLTFSQRGMLPFFRAAAGQGQVVVILSPSHYGSLAPDRLYYGRFTSWETPFGDLPSPTPAVNGRFFQDASELMAEEHGLEMFLPAAAYFWPQLERIVPLLVPNLSDLATADRLAREVLEVSQSWGGPERTIWIASSDFTHYGQRFRYEPYGPGPSPEVAAQVGLLDREIGRGLTGDENALDSAWDNFRHFQPTICGFYPALLLHHIMKHAGQNGWAGDYYTSQEVAPPARDFVAYHSLYFGSSPHA